MPTNYFDALSFKDIAALFARSANNVALKQYYRGGMIVPDTTSNALIPAQGAISVSNFYNSAGRVQLFINITSNTYNVDVYALRGPSYVAGLTDITVNVSSGVLVGSNSASTASFVVPSTFGAADTITIINNGTIVGRGGNGGAAAAVGAVGGTALSVARPVNVINNGKIAGGGGGGGGGATNIPYKGSNTPGGGGGGGAGYNGGAGGVGNGTGAAGTLDAGGAGAAPPGYAAGGAGGVQGAQGGKGGDTFGGGGSRVGAVGGLGGFYIVGNSNVTWIATGTLVGRVG